MFKDEWSVIRTKWSFPGFKTNNWLYPVRNMAFILISMVPRTVFSVASLSQGGVSDRSSRNFTPGYNMVAFQA